MSIEKLMEAVAQKELLDEILIFLCRKLHMSLEGLKLTVFSL